MNIGAPVVLLRNLDSHLRLCNGTRLIIERLDSKVLKARIITSRNIGQKAIIPRVDLTPSKNDTPFALKDVNSQIGFCNDNQQKSRSNT